LAATETYQQALSKAGNEPWAAPLQRIHAEHRAAANALRHHVHAVGGKPDQDSGVWGLFAKAVEGTAKLLGNTAALKALKEGEEHGLHTYEDVLLDADVVEECKTIIRSTLLPQTREHIFTLDHLMARR
jgi:uncharacterized protein (TIGR02284 family)